MKILEVITSLSPGGGERFVVDLSNALCNSRNQIILLTLKENINSNNTFYKKELRKEVKYESLREKKFSIKTFYKLYNKIKEIQPDVVHFHLGCTFNMILPTILLYRFPLYVQTIHCRADKEGGQVGMLIRRMIYKLPLIKQITISPNNNLSYRQIYHKDSDSLIYNGREKPKAINIDEVQKEVNSYKQNQETIVVVHVARFHLLKNQRLLINSFNKLIQEKNNIILLIIGDGYDVGEGKYLQEISHKQIHFLGLKQNIGDYLRVSDAFILSSLSEAMPISLIEALSCKCIPLSTPVSGCKDIIKNRINGFLSKDFTEKSFINMLYDFINNYKNINKEQLYELYTNMFSINTCAKKYQNKFEQWIEK